MEAKKDIPLLLTHSLEDLYETYLRGFFSTYMFGPKALSFAGGTEEADDIIVRKRYLLSKVTNAQLESMFEATQFIFRHRYWVVAVPEAYSAVATWLAGVLKQKYFIPHIGQLIKTGGTYYYSHAWFATLLLFDDPGLAHHYVGFIQQKMAAGDTSDRNLSHAIYCLHLWDQKYNTNYQKDISEQLRNQHTIKRSKRYINRLLNYSKALRAGINFTQSNVFQKKLTELLNETSSPRQHAYGLFQPPIIHRFYDWEYATKQYDHYMDQYRTTGKFVKKPPATEFGKNKPVRRTTHQFEHEVRAYIHNPKRTAYLLEIKKAALLANDVIDILAGLEIDIHYHLPIEIIELCYQKLMNTLPHSIELLEGYALALLMRGNTQDQKAKQLYQQAQQLKAKYEWVEDYNIWWGRYVKVKS